MMRTLTPFLSMLIAILAILFFIEPQYNEIVKLQNEILEYKEATERYTEFSSTLGAKIQQKNSRSSIDIARLNLLIPDTVDDTHVIVDIETLAKRRGMLFGNVAVEGGDVKLEQQDSEEEGVKRDVLITNDISFEVIGTYTQFKELLRDIESSLTLFETTKITLSATEGDFQQFGITIRTYALHH